MNKSLIRRYIEEHTETINKFDELKIDEAIRLILDAIENDSTIFWCGNGGSASQANHYAMSYRSDQSLRECSYLDMATAKLPNEIKRLSSRTDTIL